MLYRRSGLLGVSGISGDVRVLLASDDPHAREAIELFTYRIACEAGALVSALGGLDGLVFTAGIGEHAPRDSRCRMRPPWPGSACASTAPPMRPMPPASARRTAKSRSASSPRTKKP